jgi:hypothetical protein
MINFENICEMVHMEKAGRVEIWKKVPGINGRWPEARFSGPFSVREGMKLFNKLFTGGED